MNPAGSLSVYCYRRPKPMGKLRRRVQELRIRSSSFADFVTSGPTLDLSHSEISRLAVDCLLSRGLQGYYEVLDAEGEVDLLSDLEKTYIRENGKGYDTIESGASDDDDQLENPSVDSLAMSSDSDPTLDDLDDRDVKTADLPRDTESSVEVYLHSDNRESSMKDLVREFLRKAKKTLCIVMDCFSDVELLCDLLEVSMKRNVSVHLLLDHLNLNLFLSMWQELKLDCKQFPKLSVCSVNGQTYCARTGKKLTGQVAENFIMADWNEVLTGSYSFSWLSWQVHRNLAVIVKGIAVLPFHQEFQQLSSGSRPVSEFGAVPHSFSSHGARHDNTGKRSSRSRRNKAACPWTCADDAQNTQQNAKCPAIAQYNDLFHFKSSDCAQELSMPVEKQRPPAEWLCTGLCLDPLEKETQTPDQALNYTHDHSNPLAQTSNVQVQLMQLSIRAATEGFQTHRQDRPVHYQSYFRSKPDHHVGPDVLSFKQRNRIGTTLSSAFFTGLNAQRDSMRYSLKQNKDFVNNDPKTTTTMQFSLSYPKGHTSNVPPLRSREQPSLQSHPTTKNLGSKSTGTQLKPQLRTEPPSKLIWSYAARPGPAPRYNSFTDRYGTEQVRSRHLSSRSNSSRSAESLGRSKNITERLPAK